MQDGPEGGFYLNDGGIVVHQSAGYRTCLRSARASTKTSSFTASCS